MVKTALCQGELKSGGKRVPLLTHVSQAVLMATPYGVLWQVCGTLGIRKRLFEKYRVTAIQPKAP